MASNIDPTKPADGVAAIKADLRNNLQAAKSEIEALQAAGGGDATTASNIGGGVGLFSQKTGSSLEFKTLSAGANMAINLVDDTLELAASASGGSSAHVVDVRNDFGAVGDGSADDTEAIQNAIDAAPDHKSLIFLPAGRYRITSPLVIPTVADYPDQIKKVILKGESGDINGASPDGFGSGGTMLLFEYPSGGGACIDAYSAFTGTETNQDPGWGGGLIGLAIHNYGGGANYGVKVNAMLGCVLDDLYINGFARPMWVLGEYYYTKIHHCRFRNGTMWFNAEGKKSGGGPKGNGATFVECNFRGCNLRFGDEQWMGALLKFHNCWFEDIDADEQPVLRFLKAGQVIFDGCYFEDQNNGVTNFIEYRGLRNGEGLLAVMNGRVRMTAADAAFIDVRAGGSGDMCKIVLQNMELGAHEPGCVAIRKNERFPEPIHIVSIGNITPEEDVALFRGEPSDVQTLVASADDCTLDWPAVGARNAVKPDWKVVS